MEAASDIDNFRDIDEEEDALTIRGRPFLEGGEAESFGDHRIVMAAALAVTFPFNLLLGIPLYLWWAQTMAGV